MDCVHQDVPARPRRVPCPTGYTCDGVSGTCVSNADIVPCPANGFFCDGFENHTGMFAPDANVPARERRDRRRRPAVRVALDWYARRARVVLSAAAAHRLRFGAHAAAGVAHGHRRRRQFTTGRRSRSPTRGRASSSTTSSPTAPTRRRSRCTSPTRSCSPSPRPTPPRRSTRRAPASRVPTWRAITSSSTTSCSRPGTSAATSYRPRRRNASCSPRSSPALQ